MTSSPSLGALPSGFLPPGYRPLPRKTPAPNQVIRIDLVARDESPTTPGSSPTENSSPPTAGSSRRLSTAPSRSRSPSPGKHVWANSRLPHKKLSEQGDSTGVSPDSMTAEEAEDLVLSRKRRNRTSSTPQAIPEGDASSSVPETFNPSIRRGSHASTIGQKWTPGLGGWSTGPSIWKERDNTTAKIPQFLGPEPGQYRRFSLGPEKSEDAKGASNDGGKARAHSRPTTPIGGLPDSKVSEAAHRPMSASGSHVDSGPTWPSSRDTGDLLAASEPTASNIRGPLPPPARSGWNDSSTTDHLSPFAQTLGLPSRLQQRRLSHSPNLFSEDAMKRFNRTSAEGDPSAGPVGDLRRRHSLAGPLVINDALAQLENMNLRDTPIYAEINEYFENTEYRTRAWVEAGKNLQMQNTAQEQWPIFVVEFKAGRIDYFYNPVKSSVLSSGTTSGDSAVSTSELAAIRIGDLVIVEADRGKDLGKVICDSIMNAAQLQQFRSQHRNVMLDAHADREVHPKRIFKLAYPNEIAMLVAKSQDEAKATAVCQTKIRQRKLPMEVVDAEYQWDRRKLTFYFVAESRIDFRDLVKDLFKVYKTRIWMCAVDPAKVVR